MNRSESKYRNTATKMYSALFSLLESKEFPDISIKDVCAAAGVNRSTFYAHYDNTYELLNEAFQNTISDFSRECDFGSHVDLSDINSLGKDELNFASPKYLLPYLKYVQKNKRLFKIYADNAIAFETANMDLYLIDNVFTPIYAKHGVTDKKTINYMQKFFLRGVDAVVSEWVKNDCEDDVMFVCEMLIKCIRPNAYSDETT